MFFHRNPYKCKYKFDASIEAILEFEQEDEWNGLPISIPPYTICAKCIPYLSYIFIYFFYNFISLHDYFFIKIFSYFSHTFYIINKLIDFIYIDITK